MRWGDKHPHLFAILAYFTVPTIALGALVLLLLLAGVDADPLGER